MDLPVYDHPEVTEDLERVREMAEQVRQAISARDEAIRTAQAAGHSLRELGAAAGMSHQGIKNVVERKAGRFAAVLVGGLALAGLGVGVGVTFPSPHAATPPGWTAHPHVGTPGTQVCFNGACYLVDSQGNPYGQPIR